MVGLAVAQMHRRWNICVIVEEFVPCSKVALQSWLDVCRGEAHIAFHADMNYFKVFWGAEWEEVIVVMKDKELPFFMFV